MADDARVREMLDESYDSNRTPEEVCGDSPELLRDVRQRWQRMRRVEAELDALFPTSQPNDMDRVQDWLSADTLPTILGYEIESMIGRGGMGIVYKARELRLNRVVAVKMLLGGAAAGTHERERFLREAEAIAVLQHPNIVQVFGAGDYAGRPYFTMEFVEGGSLAQRLQGQPQPARSSADMIATLARAVHVAHQNGIVHRDLKPGNILLAADGTPKIADFGLARHLDGGPALTMSGARLGTPSYMAPEQAFGATGNVGPAADVYALGAVLYEMLTGRPPFRAETAVETEHQLLSEEPVAPTRLNPRVPRDLETICLKCLHKSPPRRYNTAADLADDLQRFVRHEPITARPIALVERAVKLVWRYPTHTAILTASLVLLSVLVAGGVWLALQNAQRRYAVEADVKEMRAHQESARWDDARTVLERAEARLSGNSPSDLNEQLVQARRDLDFVIQLEGIRLKRVTRGELPFYKQQSNDEYVTAFRAAGLGTFQDSPEQVAERIKLSAVHGALEAAVYDWAVCARDTYERDWLLEVARRSASKLNPWRARALEPATWNDRQALTELTQTAPVRAEPVSLLLAIGERLQSLGGDSVPFLRRVQNEHPADFWANLVIGNVLLTPLNAGEATGYVRAALASRPGEAVSYCVVGDAMRFQGLTESAVTYYQKALEIDPSYARTHNNLGVALQALGRFDEAIEAHKRAVKLDPDYAWAQSDLGNALRTEGRYAEASEHYQEAIRLDPTNRETQAALSSTLILQGRAAEALGLWKQALDSNPSEYAAWSGYAELCLYVGRDDEYDRTRRLLLERFATNPELPVAEQVGRVGLLRPGSNEVLEQSAALIDKAYQAKDSTPQWIHPYFAFAEGIAEYRRNRPEKVIELMNGEASYVLSVAPRLMLAMAQHQVGDEARARSTLAAAVVTFDWSATQADSRDAWICHILRREAEELILPDLARTLRGEVEPEGTEERLALTGVCQFRGRNYSAGRYFAEAFAADPSIENNLDTNCYARVVNGQAFEPLATLATRCRYPAARSAALASVGIGEDAGELSLKERAQMRRQALNWLRADLAMWSRTLDSGSAAAPPLVRRMLKLWLADQSLAGIRDDNEFSQLTADERHDVNDFWREVAQVLARAN